MSFFTSVRGSGYRFIQNPPVEGLNMFTAATEAAAEIERDNYFTANPSELQRYNSDSQLMIYLRWPDTPTNSILQNRVSSTWVNTFNAAVGTLDLSVHSVTELNDVTDSGSGQIITDAERTALSTALDEELAEDYLFIGNGSNVASAISKDELQIPTLLTGLNSTGVLIPKGSPVYMSGTHASGKPEISLADNTAAATMPSIGLTMADIADTAEGLIIVNGYFNNVNTAAFSDGDALYVGAAGALTATKPTGATEIQKVAIVTRSHASAGSVLVTGAGRSNDLPNLTQNKIWKGDANGVPVETDLTSESSFTKVSVGVADSPYTITGWNQTVEIHNDTGAIELVMPAMTSDDEGKELKFWVEHNTANHKITFKAPTTADEINYQAAEGAEVAKAEVSSNHPNLQRITAQCMGANESYIDGIDSLYAQLRYAANFSATSDFSPYSYLQLSAIPADFMTSNADWWFAVKVEAPMINDADAQVLFGSNNFFVSYRGNGTYLMTSGTSGYLQTVSPNTIVEAGQWIIYQYDSSTTYYTAWINGVKVLDATSSGATPPSTAPTNMWFGSETGQASGPSGYGYPLQTCKISCIALGSGNLTDGDAALFTSGQYETPTISGGTLTNQWIPDASSMTTDTGAVNMTAVGSNLTFEEL